VRSGTVRLVDGDGDVVAQLGPGEHFGEAALLAGTPHTTSAVAAGPVRLWALDRPAFDDVLCRYLDLAGQLAETGARRQARQALRGTAAGRFLDVEVGDPAPDIRLESVGGPGVALSDFRGERAVLLWFSRGNNCPYCRAYTARLGADVDRFAAAGVQILQVAPNSVEGAREFFRGRELPFPFLCDPEKAAYRLCGLHDIGGGEANRNNVKGFAHAVAVGEGTQTLRAVWLDLRHAATGPLERVAHHGLAAVEQGMFLVDRCGTVRRKYVFGPLDEPPSTDELICAATELLEVS
jgi:peroxiredoxin